MSAARYAAWVCWAVAAAATAYAIVGWRAAVVALGAMPYIRPLPEALPDSVSPPSMAALVSDRDRFVSRDPFRLAPAVQATPAALLARPSLPVLGLGGTMHLSGQWMAVLVGVPGMEGGTLVLAGEEVGGVRVVRVHRDSAVVRVMDSTLTLQLRTPWAP